MLLPDVEPLTTPLNRPLPKTPVVELRFKVVAVPAAALEASTACVDWLPVYPAAIETLSPRWLNPALPAVVNAMSTLFTLAVGTAGSVPEMLIMFGLLSVSVVIDDSRNRLFVAS